MLATVFVDKTERPSGEELSVELGSTKEIWDQFISELIEENEIDVQEWGLSSSQSAWALRLKKKKRTIVYLIPGKKCFQVGFVLGDKAVRAARERGLSADVLKIIDEAPRYAEGTGFRLEVRRPKDLATIKKLAQIKVAS